MRSPKNDIFICSFPLVKTLPSFLSLFFFFFVGRALFFSLVTEKRQKWIRRKWFILYSFITVSHRCLSCLPACVSLTVLALAPLKRLVSNGKNVESTLTKPKSERTTRKEKEKKKKIRYAQNPINT